MKLRKRIYEIVEVADDKDTLSKIYDSAILAFVVLSLVPVALKGEGIISAVLEIITTVIFLIDYVMRFATADYKLKKGGGLFPYLSFHSDGNSRPTFYTAVPAYYLGAF